MNKKLIAAAIAAVMAAPVVSAADTTLYGKVHVDVRNSDSSATVGAATAGVDNYTVNSNASRLGVKGSEDLGDGLKAIFGLEWTYDVTDGGANGAARNSFGGLSGGFGTVVVGRHDTPAKIALNSAKLSVVSDSIVDFEASQDFSEVRASNAIAYISPNFSGFTVAAAVVPGEQSGNPAANAAIAVTAGGTTITTIPAATTTIANSNDGIADSYSLGLMYAGGGLKAGLGYEMLGDGNEIAGITSDQKMWQIAASYMFGDFTVGAAYENTDDLGTFAGLDKKTWAITAKANFGNNYVFANYGNTEYDYSNAAVGVTGNLDGDIFGIGVGHKFSKRTQVYAAYNSSDVSGPIAGVATSVESDTFALGMIHDF